MPVGDAYSYMHEYAEEHVTLTMLNPQFTGNADTALFCFDANTWIDDPEFVVIEESIAVTSEEAVIVTTDIDETAYDRTESYIVRPTVTVTGRQDVSDRINARLAQLYDDTQRIIGELEQEPLPENAGKHLYTLTLKDVSATGSLLFLTFEEVRYTSGAARPMSGQYVLIFDTATGQEAELKELLVSGPEASEQLVSMIEAGLTEKYAANLFVDAGTAAGYALTNERVTWKMGADGLHILYPGDWISPRYLGTLDVALTQEQLSSLLAGEQPARGRADCRHLQCTGLCGHLTRQHRSGFRPGGRKHPRGGGADFRGKGFHRPRRRFLFLSGHGGLLRDGTAWAVRLPSGVFGAGMV